MHILLIHQHFVTDGEAGGTRHFDLARHLVANGDRVTVVTSPVSYLSGVRTPPARGLPEGLAVKRTGGPAGGRSSFAGRLTGFISFMASSFVAGLGVRGTDVVWGTTPPLFQAPAAWAVARLKRVPFVLEVRDLWPDFAVELGILRNPALIRLAKALERFVYRRADLIVVNSPGFADHVKEEGGGHIVLVANGVDPVPFVTVDRASRRRELGWEGRFVTLYAGAHGVPNDLQVVLEAARAAGPSDGLFVLVGAGRDLSRLRRLAGEWELDNVRFLGPRPKSEMPGYLAAADVCVAILKPIPLFTTTYPNKVFDYMAAGRPVLLAIDGVVREVVEEAGAGVFVPPGDPGALLKAARSYRRDPARAAREGAAGRAAVAERFHGAGQAAKLAGALRRVVKTREPPTG